VTDSEIMSDRRFKEAIRLGESTRAIAVFLKIKFPGTEYPESLPKEERENALDCVIDALMEKNAISEELAKEMR
jgi:hypothetical protein